MTHFLKASLLASAAFGFGVLGAWADDAADAERELSTVVVVGQAKTYSSSETSEAMAAMEAPVTSITAQIDSLAGVNISEGDTFGFDDWSTSIAVRGFVTNLGEQQVGITIDGLPNGGSNYGGGAKANRYIDTQNAGAIEVSQGTADIASRSNEALGGTLNFTTQNPLDDERIRLSASIGDFDAQRLYGRYDTGLFLNDTTKAWISLSTQSATDHIDGSAENKRDHIAAKIMSEQFGWDFTGYLSFDDTHEDNYQRLWSAAQFESNPDWDMLNGNWSGIPYIDQNYRRAWSTLRENLFMYARAEKEFDNGLSLEFNVYRHDNDGRGDWAPPYLVGAGDYAGQFSMVNGEPDVRFYFVDPDGNALSPDPACTSSIPAQYDAACYQDNALAVQSYRHTHYQKERTGLTADFEWEKAFEGFENTVRGGIWYEDATRYEYRDWHKITDTRVGFDYDFPAYYVQYNRQFPQTSFKWYVEDVVNFGDFTARFGLKQFTSDIDREDLFTPNDPTLNFSLNTESDVLLSGGLAWTPAAIDGLELFAGYAENFKTIPDGVLEVIDVSNGIPDPETADNIEIGARYANNRFRGSAVYFDSTFENRLFEAPTETIDGIDYLEASNGGYINGGGIESSGIELTGEYLVNENLTLYAAYTYTDAEIIGTGDAKLDAAVGIYAGNTVPGIAENMLVTSANFTKGNFYGGLSLKWVDDRFVDLANTWVADGYVDSNLHVGVQGEEIADMLKGLDLNLTVNNLFDEDYLSGISGGGAWVSAPRTVVFTVTADF